MKDTHLSIETLAQLLAGELDHEVLANRVVPHLLARCPTCRRRFEEIQLLQKQFAHWDERVAVFEGQQAPELLETLLGLPFDEQLSLVVDEPSFQTWALCQLLLKRSLEAGFEEPVAAVNLAELAVNISLNLGDAYDPHWVLDLRARAHGYLGNARRVMGELRSSETAFRKADSFLARSMTGNLQVRAEVLELRSSLLRDQRLFEEALKLSDDAISLYGKAGERHGIGSALVKKAQILEETGSLEQAIQALERAAEHVDPTVDPRLFLCTRHNLLLCLISAGRFQEAKELLPEVQELLRSAGNPLDHLRLQWLEGRIMLGIGEAESAEIHFRQVQKEFLNRGMAYDAALISLDLAVVLAQEGRNDELRQLAIEIIPIFEAQDVHREALAAMLMFQNACKEDRLTVELVHQVALLLEQSRNPKGHQA